MLSCGWLEGAIFAQHVRSKRSPFSPRTWYLWRWLWLAAFYCKSLQWTVGFHSCWHVIREATWKHRPLMVYRRTWCLGRKFWVWQRKGIMMLSVDLSHKSPFVYSPTISAMSFPWISSIVSRPFLRCGYGWHAVIVLFIEKRWVYVVGLFYIDHRKGIHCWILNKG